MSEKGRKTMVEPVRISSQDAYKKVKAGEAILVCGYEDEAKFKAFHLEMAISVPEFLEKLATLSKDQEIIFYCA
jgi:rhodanese-related sulfurtransferase